MGPIGVFDSGYGGLTVFREIVQRLPQYDYIYLGDNARVPYGNRSFETVYQYTLQCVEKLFSLGAHLVILACNTASAKALRTIQRNDLPKYADRRNVLGVIRPTTERIGQFTTSRHVGILATSGTVQSQSYVIEISRFFPDVHVFQQACPMWVPLVENNQLDTTGTAYFVERDLRQLMDQSDRIDTVVLACTHYPLLLPVIQRYLDPAIRIIWQGPLVAESFAGYLQHHPDMEAVCSKNGSIQFYTTDQAESFEEKASLFYRQPVSARQIKL